MKCIITREEVIAEAFTTGEYLNLQAVTEADIAAATIHYVEPIVGASLCEALCDGEYESLREEYVKSLLALAVRLEIQPTLDMRTGGCGSVVTRTATAEPADSVIRSRHRRALRRRVRALSHRLSRYLDENRGFYPEYDPAKNILKRCSTDGGFVQIF